MKTLIVGNRDNDFFRIEIPKSEVFGTVDMGGCVFTAYLASVEIEALNGKQTRKITVIEC